jgi:hypothetical protein
MRTIDFFQNNPLLFTAIVICLVILCIAVWQVTWEAFQPYMGANPRIPRGYRRLKPGEPTMAGDWTWGWDYWYPTPLIDFKPGIDDIVIRREDPTVPMLAGPRAAGRRGT